MTVPLGTLDKITGVTFDIPQFEIVQQFAANFQDHSVTIIGSGVTYTIPCVIGYNYQSQGQLCRPQMAADVGARTGPGFAKKRKTNKYGINLVNSLAVRVGLSFDKTNPVPMISPLGKSLPYLSTFSGIARETLDDDFTYNSMLCWQTTRPYPATVVAYGGFVEIQESI